MPYQIPVVASPEVGSFSHSPRFYAARSRCGWCAGRGTGHPAVHAGRARSAPRASVAVPASSRRRPIKGNMTLQRSAPSLVGRRREEPTHGTPDAAQGRRRRGGRRHARFPRDHAAGAGCGAALRAAGQPHRARSGLDQRDRDADARLPRLRHALRRGRAAQAAAADGGRPHRLRRRPRVARPPAGRAAVPRRRTGARAGLRREPGALVEARPLRAAPRRLRGRLARRRRPHARGPPDQAVPAAAGRAGEARRQRALHHAGAPGRGRRERPGRRGGGIGPLPLPSGRVRLRQPRRLRQVRRLRAAAGAAGLGLGRQGRALPAGRVAHPARPGDGRGGAPERRGRLAGAAPFGSRPDARPQPQHRARGAEPRRPDERHAAQPPAGAVQRPQGAAGGGARREPGRLHARDPRRRPVASGGSAAACSRAARRSAWRTSRSSPSLRAVWIGRGPRSPPPATGARGW